MSAARTSATGWISTVFPVGAPAQFRQLAQGNRAGAAAAHVVDFAVRTGKHLELAFDQGKQIIDVKDIANLLAAAAVPDVAQGPAEEVAHSPSEL